MLTPAQISQATGKGTSPTGAASQSQAMTPEQAQQWASSKTPVTSAIPSTGLPGSHAFATPTTPTVQNPMDDISNAGANVEGDITGENQGQGVGEQNPFERGVRAVSDAAGGAMNAVADVIPGGKPALQVAGNALGGAEKFAGNISSTLADISQKIGIMSPAQRAQFDKQAADFANSDAGQKITNQADTFNSLGNIANTILGAKGGADAIQKTVDAVPRAVASVKQSAQAVKTAVTPSPKSPEAVSASRAKGINAIATEWQKPTEGSTPAFNNARDVLAKDPSIPQFLAEQKANPSAHINEQDRFETSDTAQALRDTAGKMSNETLRPSLVAADYSTPKTPVAEIRTEAIKNADADTSLTPGERTSVVRNINKETSAFENESPDGLSLTNMHDSKITYSGKAGYSPTKTALENAPATANRHIASALQKTVEAKAPEGVPVADFNQYLGKYYKAADYLDALNGKKAPISTGTRLARAWGRLAGLTVASHIGGGGILADVLGYRIGGVLEHAVEHMTSPARAAFLKNLEVSNPKAFTQVQDYLKSQNSGNNGMLRLPAAGKDTPIPLGAGEQPKANIAPHAAKTPLPTANPKTGRMQTTYTSEPRI